MLKGDALPDFLSNRIRHLRLDARYKLEFAKFFTEYCAWFQKIRTIFDIEEQYGQCIKSPCEEQARHIDLS